MIRPFLHKLQKISQLFIQIAAESFAFEFDLNLVLFSKK